MLGAAPTSSYFPNKAINMDKKIIAVIVAAVVIVVAAAAFVALSGNDDKDNGPDTPGVDDTANQGKIVGNTLGETQRPNKDSRLWIYGNANEDDKIDASDIEYVRGIISGTNTKTILADANGDGVVDEKDVQRIQKIIDQKEIDVYYVNDYFEVAKVSWPVKTIGISYVTGAYIVDLCNLGDKVTVIDDTIRDYWNVMNPSAYGKAVCYGNVESPNFEQVLTANPDVFVHGWPDTTLDPQWTAKLSSVGIDVMFMNTADNSGVRNEYIDRMIVMQGFLLQGDMDKVYEYLAWHDEVIQKITDAGSKIDDKDKINYLMLRRTQYTGGGEGVVRINGASSTNSIHAEWAGVNAISEDSGSGIGSGYPTISIETLLADIEKYKDADNVFCLADNLQDGIRQQYSLKTAVETNKTLTDASPVKIRYIAMAREVGNSPLYVVEMAWYQDILYGDVVDNGLDYKELFDYYFQHFTSYDYSVSIDHFFYDGGYKS